MTLAWRVLKEKHQGEAFSGEGAKLFGGRWNRKGQAVVYLADSMALAALEQFVHLTPPRPGHGLWLFSSDGSQADLY